MLIIIIFGPPGSGKGTQSENIIEKYKLAHLSTGDLLRVEKNSGSPLGIKIAELINNGNLVPDEMVEQMVESFILTHASGNGFVLDGFPRTVKQAIWLDSVLNRINKKVNVLLSLEVNDDELRTRLIDRGKLSGRDDDQNTETINNRIELYHRKTEPVIDFYKGQLKFKKVLGFGAPDEVFTRICGVVDSITE